MHNPIHTPALATATCHSCREPYPVADAHALPDIPVCPACTNDLSEQARAWQGLPREAGEGEV